MSDARQQAIDAALATGVPIHKGYIAEVIDAIPGDVHARLAIDKGALIETEGETPGFGGYMNMVYRLAGKDPQP